MSLIACCNGQSAFGNACNSLVSAKMEKSALAGLPQTSWHLPRDLRESRKRQSKRRETCGSPANTKANAARLAGVPANAKVNAARLAGVPANAKVNAARLAGVPANTKKFSEAFVAAL